MRWYLISAFVIILGVLVFTLRDARAPQEHPETSDFDRLASLTFTDYAGRNVSLSAFAGTPLIINSWAVWCPFCRAELPDFAQLQQEFGEQIRVIAIDRRESRQTAQAYTDELGITNAMTFLLDPTDSFYQSIGGFAMPETIFLNNDGEIVLHKRGPMSIEEMREQVRTSILGTPTSL